MVLAALTCALVAATGASALPGTFRTGIYDPQQSAGGPGAEYAYLSASVAFPRTRSTGSKLVRIPLYWSRVSPDTEPSEAAKALPATYSWDKPRWYDFDRQLRAAWNNGLTPVVSIFHAPRWAECDGDGYKRQSQGGCVPDGKSGAGKWKPDPKDFALFVKALTLKYPKIRYFQMWNEPNAGAFLWPGRSPSTVARYRSMVNQASAVVHAANPNNVVIAGGTSPRQTPSTYAPFDFLALLLKQPVSFDTYSTHPYTQGGPTTAASVKSGIAWVGNLKRMHSVLVRAKKNNKIVVAPRHSLGFWVTEFSWDSSPPDCKRWAVPLGLLARWVSETPYRMWRAGVSGLIWAQLKDYPMRWPRHGGTNVVYPWQQGGLFAWGGVGRVGKPKAAMRSFRFPFVAFKRTGGVYVWGRTPSGKAGRVVIQRRTSSGWKTVKTLRTNGGGIFQKRFALHITRSGKMRARLAGTKTASVTFALKAPPNRTVLPFGCIR